MDETSKTDVSVYSCSRVPAVLEARQVTLLFIKESTFHKSGEFGALYN